MSLSKISGNVQKKSEQPEWDILAVHKGIKIDVKFVLNLTKRRKNVNKEAKDSCKILQFSSEWNLDEVLSTIHGLDPREFPQLFIFIIKTNNIGFTADNQEELSVKSAKLQEKLLKFGGTRPMILQLTLEDKKITKIYNKDETAVQFLEINQKPGKSEKLNTSSSFLRSFLNEKFDNLKHEAFKALSPLSNRSLALRFLRSLNLSDGFFGILVLDVVVDGTSAEFLAALDSPFDSNGRILSNIAQKYIYDVFGGDDPQNDDSVLLKALKNKNKEVIDYLITYWTHLIQQLPFDHQVSISTAALETNQLDILCDLLDIADYPFPNKFKPETIEHERLCKIYGERIDFNAAIEAEDFEKIDKFISNNLNLKFIYNHEKNSALTEAIKLKKFAIFYFLKSFGCRGENCDDVLEKLNEKEKEEANNQATKQRRINVQKAQININNSVLKLSIRSLIHNSKISKEQDAEYRRYIMKWFEDIRKVAPELIDVAASCEHLKIIFDFESDSVENMSLTDSNSDGTMYPVTKWIFVGAKLSDRNGNVTKQREQQIKGVLAHEFGHYVMKLVYENQENPYYKHMIRDRDIFEGIVRAIDKWSKGDPECPDDECNGIISSVFKLYNPRDFHPELIVRIVQILAEFDNNNEHVRYLQHKYRSFFVFWETLVIPELQKFINENREGVRKINEAFGLMKDFESRKIQLCLSNDLKILDNNQSVIIKTNIPKLLIINICNHLQQKYGNQLDTQNLFVNPEELINEKMISALRSIIAENAKLNIFVDCSKDVDIDWKSIKFRENSKLVFIVSNENQFKNIRDTINNAAVIKIDYNWAHLKEESQLFLLETKINFQNNSELTLLDLFKENVNPQKLTKGTQSDTRDGTILKMFSDIVDDQLLKVLLNGTEILIFNPLQDRDHEKIIEFLFQPRKFLKDHINGENSKNSQEELFTEIKNKQFVLISDQAGNGKSWAMKNFSKILREQNPTSWVTYVDLKQYIDDFKEQEKVIKQKMEKQELNAQTTQTNKELDFSTFMAMKIWKLQKEFEVKIFQKMYKNGKVFIIFDGFDEIAPNCAEFVSKLVQNFESNGGNQLWIATRDYFEVDLKKKLKLDIAYSLDEMTENGGVDLIAKSWVLMDSKQGKNEPKSRKDFDKCIQISSNYESYQHKARQIIKKALISRNTSVGLPQLFKMIADGFKDEENLDNLQGSKIYGELIKILYKRWSDDKGHIRKEASVDSQTFYLNFYKFHHYHAILSLFSELAAILYPRYKDNIWLSEEIIACGIMTIKNGKKYFLHETFREYFVAAAIADALEEPEIDEKVVETFIEILTVEKFGVIRMFLNDKIDDEISLQKYQAQMKKICKIEYFSKLFEDYFQLALVIVKSVNYKVVFDFFYIHEKFRNSDLKKFLKVQEYFLKFINIEDLKKLIMEEKCFKKVIESNLEMEIFDDLVNKAIAKTDREFIKQGLMVVSGKTKENIFCSLFQSSNLNEQKVQKFLQIFDKLFLVDEIFKLMSTSRENNQSILKVCVLEDDRIILKHFWIVIENFFAQKGLSEKFRELVKQKDNYNNNLINSAKKCSCHSKIEAYKTLWELLLKTFNDREELTNFILESSWFEYKPFPGRIVSTRNEELSEWTLNLLKENTSYSQYERIKTQGRKPCCIS